MPPFQCYCKAQFSNSHELRNHQCRECRGTFCSCGRLFQSKEAMIQHKQAKQHIKCKVCSRSFPKSLAEHGRHADRPPPMPLWQRKPCLHCWKSFECPQKAKEHMTVVHRVSAVFYCNTCDRTFKKAKWASSHEKTSVHAFCDVCRCYFNTRSELKSHEEHVHLASCCDCNREFLGQKMMQHHCCSCGKSHRSEDALREHACSEKKKKGSEKANSCPGCGKKFSSKEAMNQHMRDRGDHARCEKCQRNFKSTTALQQHMNSTVHKPLSKIKCPLAKCKKTFKSPSALLHHLESGFCKSGLDRKKINEFIVQHDTQRLITAGAPSSTSNATESLTEMALMRLESTVPTPSIVRADPQPDEDDIISLSSSSGDGGVNLTPLSTSSFEDLEHPWALVQSLPHSPLLTPASSRRGSTTSPKRSALHCPMCPPERAPFKTPTRLKQHIDSPAHAPKLFSCPISLAPFRPTGPDMANGKTQAHVPKQFKTLSALAQHLESGKCEGGERTFRSVVEFVQRKLEEYGVRGVPLLL